jgi:hypothetical protein
VEIWQLPPHFRTRKQKEEEKSINSEIPLTGNSLEEWTSENGGQKERWNVQIFERQKARL